jgi:DNA-binding CsgD family transcriptional regulator
MIRTDESNGATAEGMRVRVQKSEQSRIDGPFTETKEMIGNSGRSLRMDRGPSDHGVLLTPILQMTPSERRALQLLARQRPPAEIAVCLDVTASDVGWHLHALFARMGVSSAREAVDSAVRRGLLATNEQAPWQGQGSAASISV